jgi:hypothetical protein
MRRTWFKLAIALGGLGATAGLGGPAAAQERQVYAPPPHVTAPPPQAYVPPPPQAYAPPPQALPPPQAYVPPPQGYVPPPQGYVPPPEGYVSPPGVPPPVTVGPPPIAFAAPPPLVEISPGVQVVSGYGEEVFFVDNAYWTLRGGHWYRSVDHRGAWVVADRGVPGIIVGMPRGRYRFYGRGVVVSPPRVIVEPFGWGRHRRGRHW